MRYSLLGLLGSGLITIAAGCSEADDGSVPNDDAKAGHSSKAGAAGKGGSGKAGTAGKSGATGGSSAGKGGSGSGAQGGTSAGKGGSGTGNVGAGGTLPGTGGTGSDAGASGTDTGAGAGGFSGSSDAGGEAGTAGAEAAGAGGEAGSGSGPSCPGGVECAAECFDPAVRTLDQIQLQGGGTIVLSNGQRPGQSFTVGSPGLLTGVELAVSACNGADTTGQIQLELFDEQATSLGHVTLDAAPLRTDCGINDLVEGMIGLGYFDLTPLCIAVEPSTKLTFVLSLVGGTPATCDSQTYECSNSGHPCDSDDECGGSYNVGFTGGSDYAGGEVVMQNVGSGALSPLSGFDLELKTFVQ